jgi:hypothetical protein
MTRDYVILLDFLEGRTEAKNWVSANLYEEGIPIFFYGATAPSGPEIPHYRGITITFRHTTIGRTPLDEWSARLRDLLPDNT